MQTRRDQLQAYRYLVRRVLAAMLGNEPESPEQPMRRVTAATLSGVMVGVLACGGVGVYGWLVKGSATKWKDQAAALVFEKETGARYVYVNKPPQKPTLYPVRNYTSARLILGGEPATFRVSRESIDVDRGPEVGIPGAPDALPDEESVVSTPWGSCSRQITQDQTTSLRTNVLVGISDTEIGAREVGDRGLLVKVGSAATFLVWDGRRLRIDDDGLTSLGLSGTPVPVGDAWLNTLQEGPPLVPPDVPDSGTQSSTPVDGQPTAVGEVFRTSNVNGDPTFYLMYEDGLARISQTQADLLFGHGAARTLEGQQTEATEVPTVAINSAPKSAQPAPPEELPAQAPRLADLADGSSTPLCTWYDDPTGKEQTMRVTTGGKVPEQAGSAAGDGAGVVLPPGQVAVIAAASQPDQPPSAFYLVTDAGAKYPVPDKAVLDTLGYATVEPAVVPKSITDFLRTGPALTPDSARAGTDITADAAGGATPTPAN